MDIDGASNRADGHADVQANNIMDSNDVPNSANVMNISDSANDQAEDTTDGDSMSNNTDATDANVFKIITQTQTSILLHSELIVPNPD